MDVRALFVFADDLVVDAVGRGFGMSLYASRRRDSRQKLADFRPIDNICGIGRRSRRI